MRISRALVVLAVGLLAGVLHPARADDPTAVDIEWVSVGDPENPADTEVMWADRTTGYGSVPYRYEISKYLVTNEQYAAFLNAVARESDPYLLWFPCMDITYCYGVGSGIARDGAPGSYRYAPQPGRAKHPVNYVNLFMAMRMANWMHNGQGNGDTETGAYTLEGGTVIPTNLLTVTRNPGAKVVVPSEDEWYKAAYWDPELNKYWDFPTGTDEETICGMPSPQPNTANCGLVTSAANPDNPGITGVASWFWGDVSPVGAYPNSVSPVGAYDMAGNLFQWTDVLSVSVLGQYHAGERIAPVTDTLFGLVGNPFEVNGLGVCGVVRGTDWGDGGEFNHAAGRTCDLTFDPFETYGIRLARIG